MSKEENRHANRLVPSPPDVVGMVAAVVPRYNDLIGSYHRVRGVALVIPQEMITDFHNVRRLFERYAEGDYRHRACEKSSLKTFAQWTVDVQRSLRNQESQQIQWSGDFD